MNSRLRVLLTLCTGLALGVALSQASRVVAERSPLPLASAAAPADNTADAFLPRQDARLLGEVLQRVRENYVDPVDDHQLLRRAAHGMIEGLDEHSTLLEPGEYAELQAATSGSYAGIGVEVEGVAGGVRVLRCLPGSPALRAGLRAGDLIERIDGLAVSALNIDAATQRLRGTPGSGVRLQLLRAGGPARELLLQRSLVELPSVAAELLAPGYAYLRISEFTDASPAELARALAALQVASSGALRGLVLDLRNNPGGVLEAAGAIADDFLEQGTIVSADGRVSEARFRLDATPGDLLHGAPIVVLVNGGSASAAEILAAALRQNGRASLVGRKTYGKGTVQTILPLSSGQALKLTTSRYYTPSGASINGVGITPDLLLGGAGTLPAALDAPGHASTLASRDGEVGIALARLRGAHYADGARRGRHRS